MRTFTLLLWIILLLILGLAGVSAHAGENKIAYIVEKTMAKGLFMSWMQPGKIEES